MIHSPSTLAASDLTELVPFLRRVAALQPDTIVRVQVTGGALSAYAPLPFGCLAGRSVVDGRGGLNLDLAYSVQDLVTWCDHPSGDDPPRRDADWRGGLPPATGWRRLDSIPDDVLRPLVAAGAKALTQAAGGFDLRTRNEVADALLDSVVLTVSAEGEPNFVTEPVRLTLRMLSALTRMGFLPALSNANVEVSGRWTRLAGRFGSVYSERPGSGLGVNRLADRYGSGGPGGGGGVIGAWLDGGGGVGGAEKVAGGGGDE